MRRTHLVITSGALALAASLAGLFAHANTTATPETVQEKNKRLVREFYDLAFNQHRAKEAADRFLAEAYIQHNPRVADGRKGFIDAFHNARPDDPSRTDFKRFVAEGDLVVVHSHGKEHPQDRGYAVVDIFRVKGDWITEHWDVGQKVPETSKNPNGMF